MVELNEWIDLPPESKRQTSSQLQQSDRVEMGTVTEQVDQVNIAARLDGASSGTPDVVAPSESGITAIGARVRAYRDSTGRIARFGIPDEIPAGAEVVSVGTTGEWLSTLDATAATTSAQVEAVQEKADQAAADALASLKAASKAVTGTSDEYALGASETVPPTSGWSTTPPVRTPGMFIWVRTIVTYGDGNTVTTSPVLLTGNAGAPGTSVTSVTTYYRTVTKGAAAPAKPTASPAPSPWTTTEPAYADNTELYRTDRIVYSTGSFAYTDVSKVSAYTAAAQAITVANLVEAATQGLVKPSATDPGHYKGRIWLQLDSSGRTVGIKISNGTAWSSYALMADSILVPGSIGTISIGDNAVTAPKIYATSELWTKMLNVAGDATIGGNLLAQSIAGKNILGAFIEGGELLMRGQDESGTTTQYSQTFESGSVSSGKLNGWGVTPTYGSSATSVVTAATDQKHGGSRSFKAVVSGSSTSYYVYDRVQFAGGFTSTFDGTKVLSAWVRSNVATRLRLTTQAVDANGATLGLNGADVDVAASTWTQLTLSIPPGYKSLGNSSSLTSIAVLSTLTAYTLWVDDVTMVATFDRNSYVRFYRQGEGNPTVDFADINSVVRIRITAPNDGNATLTFFDTSGNGLTLNDTGITQSIFQSQAQTTTWPWLIAASQKASELNIQSSNVTLPSPTTSVKTAGPFTFDQAYAENPQIVTGMPITGGGIVVNSYAIAISPTEFYIRYKASGNVGSDVTADWIAFGKPAS